MLYADRNDTRKTSAGIPEKSRLRTFGLHGRGYAASGQPKLVKYARYSIKLPPLAFASRLHFTRRGEPVMTGLLKQPRRSGGGA